MSKKIGEIQVPPHMLQQLLRGPMPAQKPPDVIEVMSSGLRLCFNVDAIECVCEGVLEQSCQVKIKGLDHAREIDMTYDEFLKAISVEPRVLNGGPADSGD